MTDPTANFLMAGIGELLWDLLPDGKQLGGSPMNVAYHCKAAGINSVVISAIGKDDSGQEILNTIKPYQISCNYIQLKQNYPTGTVTVKLNKGIPDFIIHNNVAWDYIAWNDQLMKLAKTVDAVAFGSLSQRNKISRETIQNFLEHMKPGSIRVFDINLRQAFHSYDIIKQSLKKATVLKINDEELPVLAKYMSLQGTIPEQLRSLINTYSLDLIAYTMGAEGSWLISKDEYSDIQTPKVSIADTVGAGDAFTGVMIAGLLENKELGIIHKEASEIAAWVCTKAGAMPVY